MLGAQASVRPEIGEHGSSISSCSWMASITRKCSWPPSPGRWQPGQTDEICPQASWCSRPHQRSLSNSCVFRDVSEYHPNLGHVFRCAQLVPRDGRGEESKTDRTAGLQMNQDRRARLEHRSAGRGEGTSRILPGWCSAGQPASPREGVLRHAPWPGRRGRLAFGPSLERDCPKGVGICGSPSLTWEELPLRANATDAQREMRV